MLPTFQGEFEKQLRITNFLSRKLRHSRFHWVKLFPSNPANVTPAGFHADVDYKGWNVVVGILQDGSVVGGFTTVGWTSAANPTTLSDPYAFLFTLPAAGAEVFFPAVPGQVCQITHNGAEGPSFGNKELYFSLAVAHTGSQCDTLVNYMVEAPITNGVGVVSDPSNPANAWTPGAGTKQLLAVEVYQITPAEYPLPSAPYDDKQQLARIASLLDNLKTKGLQQVNICFIGDAKAGKSTSLNNFMSVLSLDQVLQTHAYATNLQTPGTTHYSKYPLSAVGQLVPRVENKIPIFLSDTPGFTAAYFDKIEMLIPFIAQGRVPVGWDVLSNPAFLPQAGNSDPKEWIHLFVVVIPADAITNPVKMDHFRRIELSIRTKPPTGNNQVYPTYPNVVYLVTQMDDPSRGGDVLLSAHPHQFGASELWATYKKRLNSPTGIGSSSVIPVVNITEQGQEIPQTYARVFLDAWSKILLAVQTNVSRWTT